MDHTFIKIDSPFLLILTTISREPNHHTTICTIMFPLHLPEDVVNHILAFSNPYKDQYTQCVVNSREMWDRIWVRWYEQQDPLTQFVADYLFELWGVRGWELPGVPGVSEGIWELDTYAGMPRGAFLPSDIRVMFRVLADRTVVTVYSENVSGVTMIFYGDLYDTCQWQYQYYCADEASENPSHETVHWDDTYHLVKVM